MSTWNIVVFIRYRGSVVLCIAVAWIWGLPARSTPTSLVKLLDSLAKSNWIKSILVLFEELIRNARLWSLVMFSSVCTSQWAADFAREIWHVRTIFKVFTHMQNKLTKQNCVWVLETNWCWSLVACLRRFLPWIWSRQLTNIRRNIHWLFLRQLMWATENARYKNYREIITKLLWLVTKSFSKKLQVQCKLD